MVEMLTTVVEHNYKVRVVSHVSHVSHAGSYSQYVHYVIYKLAHRDGEVRSSYITSRATNIPINAHKSLLQELARKVHRKFYSLSLAFDNNRDIVMQITEEFEGITPRELKNIPDDDWTPTYSMAYKDGQEKIERN